MMQQVPQESVKIPLLCDEDDFGRGRESFGPTLSEVLLFPRPLSIMAYICWLASLRMRILDEHCTFNSLGEHPPWHSKSNYPSLQHQLDDLSTNLPNHLALDQNAAYLHRADISAFVTFQILLQVCYWDLYKAGPRYQVWKDQGTTQSPLPEWFVLHCERRRRTAAYNLCLAIEMGSSYRWSGWDPFISVGALIAV